MSGLDSVVLRSLTRPFRVAMYKRSSEFESAVEAELVSLRLEAPHAPAELLRAKMMRDGIRATRRAVMTEAARRLAGDPNLERLPIGIMAKPRGEGADIPSAPRVPKAAPVIEAVDLSNLSEARKAEALGGEHRVTVSTPGGPDTLTEALQLMAKAGLLTVEVEPDSEGFPVLVYRPVEAPDRLPSL